MSKTTWIILAAIITTIGIIIWRSTSNTDPIDLSDINIERKIESNDQNGQIADHILGNPSAPVIIINYSDFQCPACATISPRIKALVATFDPDEVAIIHRHFPLTNMHQNARAAAAAAEAAGLQGEFWAMHDMLYHNQRIWRTASVSDRTEIFANYAEEIGIDRTQFIADLSDRRITQRINFDQAVAARKQVNATPSFFINGEPVPSSAVATDAAFRDLILRHLSATQPTE